jgi:ABC-type Zn uptake system ZnuABC Zn-binding protein ZnuA
MRLRLVLVSILLCLSLFAPAAAQDEASLDVVVSFSILGDVVNNVGLDHVNVFSLVPVGADPHGYEPSAQDIALLSNADLIFVAGGGFEETLLQTINSVSSGAVIVEASACIPVRHYSEAHTEDEHEEEAHDETHDHADAVGLDLESLCAGYDVYIAEIDTIKTDMGLASIRVPSYNDLLPLFEAGCTADHEDEIEEDGHDHGPCDPHVWTDPRSVYYWTLYIRDVLSAADPANAAAYHDNAETYLYAIDDLVRLQLEPLIEAIPLDRRVLMTNHNTLGYFAAAYGFEEAGFVLPGGSALAEPSAQDLAALIDTVRERGIAAIFTESTLSARVAEQIAAETGAQIYPLYTDSLSGPDEPAFTYLDYLTYNFTTIAAALTPQ